MAQKTGKPKIRRQQAREQRAKASGKLRARLASQVFSWPVLVSVVFIVVACLTALLGELTLGYSVGQRIDQPVIARVDFQIPDEVQTADDRKAARASTPSYYTLSASALTFDRIRAELMSVYQVGADSDGFQVFNKTLQELHLPATLRGYERLRGLGDETGRAQFQSRVDRLPLENEYVVRNLHREPRDPKSTLEYIRLEIGDAEGKLEVREVELGELVPHGNTKALQGSAASAARSFSIPELKSTVEAIVLAAFKDQPTIVYDQERTVEEMRRAEEATPEALASYEKGKAFVSLGVVGPEEYGLLLAEQAAYQDFLAQDDPEAAQERLNQLLQRGGMITLVAVLSVGLLVYTWLHHRRVFEVRTRTLAFMVLMLGTLLASRLLTINWPNYIELVYAPCLVASSVLAIAYPRRFAMGVMCIMATVVATAIDGSLTFLLVLFTGVAVSAFQLGEIRSRTKLITSGVVTALAVMLASATGGLTDGMTVGYVVEHAMWAGACAILASFFVSGVLPLIERTFRMATSLTLLEWRDPTRPLLQLLAREAPGTYNHSLVLGTLAEAACERIGAYGLLAQVGALYHDVGKIPKAEYFAENQEGQINMHDRLAPTMSLLIILGHVKDGVEMAKEYKLPRVLLQFIEEHHGTTVVRYFHYVASEKQPQIASGKHDREVSESEFRYAGPKPRSRESAVLMLCDSVEGAVRALHEPTVSRIESVVNQIITDRLNDGQFDDCDIPLKQIHQVEESLVKSLCGIYHSRVAYPKARKANADSRENRAKVSI